MPENGPPHWERPLVLDLGPRSAGSLPRVAQWLGARPVAPGTIEIDLADELRNPWGILHGGVVAMLADLAAEDAAEGRATTETVLHFLAPNRLGPVRARARVLGRRRDGHVARVEIRDEGADRVTAVAVTTSRA